LDQRNREYEETGQKNSNRRLGCRLLLNFQLLPFTLLLQGRLMPEMRTILVKTRPECRRIVRPR
jgi:hypothetical protein